MLYFVLQWNIVNRTLFSLLKTRILSIAFYRCPFAALDLPVHFIKMPSNTSFSIFSFLFFFEWWMMNLRMNKLKITGKKWGGKDVSPVNGTNYAHLMRSSFFSFPFASFCFSIYCMHKTNKNLSSHNVAVSFCFSFRGK